MVSDLPSEGFFTDKPSQTHMVQIQDGFLSCIVLRKNVCFLKLPLKGG